MTEIIFQFGNKFIMIKTVRTRVLQYHCLIYAFTRLQLNKFMKQFIKLWLYDLSVVENDNKAYNWMIITVSFVKNLSERKRGRYCIYYFLLSVDSISLDYTVIVLQNNNFDETCTKCVTKHQIYNLSDGPIKCSP